MDVHGPHRMSEDALTGMQTHGRPARATRARSVVPAWPHQGFERVKLSSVQSSPVEFREAEQEVRGGPRASGGGWVGSSEEVASPGQAAAKS